MAITPPAFQKDAVHSLKGWHHPKTNELLKSTRHTQAQIDEFNGLAVAPVVHTPMPTPVVDTVEESAAPVVDTVEESADYELASMSKTDLENLGREHGVELDRRLSKSKLRDQVSDLLKDN